MKTKRNFHTPKLLTALAVIMTLCITSDISGGVLADNTYDTTISIDPNIQHGTVTLSAYEGNVGDTITVTPKPNAGYKLKDGSLKIIETDSIINVTFQIPNTAQEEKYYLFHGANGINEGFYPDLSHYPPTVTLEGEYLSIKDSDSTRRYGIIYTQNAYDLSLYSKATIIGTAYSNQTGYLNSGVRYTFGLINDCEDNLCSLSKQIISPRTFDSLSSYSVTTSKDFVLSVDLTDVSSFETIGVEGDSLSSYKDKWEIKIYEMYLSNIEIFDGFTVTAEFEPINYSISTTSSYKGTLTASAATAHIGDTITLSSVPASGMRLSYYRYSTDGGSNWTNIAGNSFTMPAANVLVDAAYEKTGTTEIVVDPNMTNGTLQLSSYSGEAGDAITITPKPAVGYILRPGTVELINDNELVRRLGNVTTFNLPAQNSSLGERLGQASNATTFRFVKGRYYYIYSSDRYTLVNPSVTDDYYCGMQVEGEESSLCGGKSNGHIFYYYGTSAIVQIYNAITNPYDTLTITAEFIPAGDGVIYFDTQGGNGGSTYVTTTNNQVVPTITPPTRTGYTFQGYYTGTNGSGTKYYNANGTGAYTWKSTDTSPLTLYAYWTANQVSYVVNHYIETLDGSYVLYSTETKQEYTDTVLATSDVKQTISGFTISKLVR